ncbi:LysR family transcriptional regulator [Rhabdothermincola sediminis]|uniref:LysR family transcriptional regulator n=1 Tax=Rhabdothermincola sediminis TaxID=2751370 RepID=UPI001AA06B6A|nr:LysR family transcriptional regulator [Rhabdothermincola sediminis]
MDLRQLNALLAVADTGSFSAAARALHTVQSNVSTHVARLEKELGSVLIDRATGRLTEEGELVAARARRVRAELDALVADLASLHDEVAGTARIGVIGTTARWLVPRLVDAMRARHPRVRVVVVDATTTSLALQLTSGLLDLAVVNLPLSDPEIRTDHLFDEDRLLVVPAGHPLYGRDRLTLADLDGEPLLLEPKGTGFRDHLDEQCRQAGIELEPQAEVDGMRLLASLAFQGFGAALLPASAAPSWVGGEWKRVPIDGLEGRSVGLATRRKGMLSAPARALRDVVLEVVRTEGPKQPGIHADVTDR